MNLLLLTNILTLSTDAIFEIPIAIPYDGAMDTVIIIKSDITWTDLQFHLADPMVKPATKLNLGYKFSTDPCNMAPNQLANSVHLLELIEGAKNGLEAAAWAKMKLKGTVKKLKLFKVEITDLDAGKGKAKVKKSGDKVKRKKKVCWYKILVMGMVGLILVPEGQF